MSLHHVGIEIAPAEIQRAVELFEAVGFELAEPPPGLTELTWLQREGTQVHLMPEEHPTAARRGHLALVVPDLEQALKRLRERGFELAERRSHWGSPRWIVLAPGGHRVELMAFPPS